jgi:ribonucleotide monophosphatase NagD (HAD superfamily)
VGRLTGIDTVLLDLDGTLYVGSQVVPGAPEAVRWLRDQGLTVRFCTNTDSIPPAALADRLARLGLPATEEELVTPGGGRGPAVRVHRRGAGAGRGRRRGAATAGRLPGRTGRPGHPCAGRRSRYGATYDDLDGFRAVRAGAELVATQVNRIARRDDGEHLVTGRWVRLLEYATGQTARVLGKPSPEFFTAPLDALGRRPQSALVVGDDLAADIGGGRAVGAATVLVRSGKGDRPSRAPKSSRTRSSTASPTCRDCSEAERTRPQP